MVLTLGSLLYIFLLLYKSPDITPNFRYLEMSVTNLNCIYDEMKRALSSGRACYPLILKIFFFAVPYLRTQVINTMYQIIP
jgi:hypothetical protein